MRVLSLHGDIVEVIGWCQVEQFTKDLLGVGAPALVEHPGLVVLMQRQVIPLPEAEEFMVALKKVSRPSPRER